MRGNDLRTGIAGEISVLPLVVGKLLHRASLQKDLEEEPSGRATLEERGREPEQVLHPAPVPCKCGRWCNLPRHDIRRVR